VLAVVGDQQVRITKRQLQNIIQEELSQVREITASDGPSLRPSGPALQGATWDSGDDRADIDTVVSEPVDDGNPKAVDEMKRLLAVDAMKRLFQRQMRHKIRQFLDFGQEEGDIIKAACAAAEELVADEMTSGGGNT